MSLSSEKNTVAIENQSHKCGVEAADMIISVIHKLVISSELQTVHNSLANLFKIQPSTAHGFQQKCTTHSSNSSF